MGYTPGPWKACGMNRGGCVCGQVYSDPADVMVAVAISSKDESYTLGEGVIHGSEQFHANARLIAAAPQLCEALQACVKNWGPRDVFLLPEEKAALQQARAALKAAGVEG